MPGYAGSTIVSQGTLQVTGSAALPGTNGILVSTASGSTAILDVAGISGGASYTPEMGGAFSLTNGQALLGFGIVNGQTVVQNGAIVAPGRTLGQIVTLTFDNNQLIKGTFQADTVASGAQLGELIVLVNGSLTIDQAAILLLPATNAYDYVAPLTIMQVTGAAV